ncbi:MAG: carboxypeptidase regulatory-like domain-containing protein [Acidobacteria bacterium]|nr:carboxypeptidase regulatory-like domain-containing protein [Acidobacteriota bacterium]
MKREAGPKLRTLLGAGLSLLVTASLWAGTLTGRITNGTTGKAAAGDQVILIKLGAGMEEVGRTETDSQGQFRFTLDQGNAPYLVRAIHQSVTYHQPAPPGTGSLAIEVYDVSPKVEGVNAVADLMYIQADDGSLGITRIFAVDNHSNPPRTQMNEANFQFSVPQGATIDEAQAQTAGGQAVKVAPKALAQAGRYGFVFPLRPGETQFQVSYHLGYNGKASIDPGLVYPLEHFVAILPRTMSFAPTQNGVYEDRQPPNQPDAIAKIASNPQPGQRLGFEISGRGMLRSQEEDAGNRTVTGPSDTRPGGGLGTPTDAPDPLDRYRVYLLAGLGLALAVGAVYIVNRPKLARRQNGESSSAPGGRLLNALKEELFELELEHQRGQISPEEYAKTKAALDETLARALKRSRLSS